MSHSHFAQTLLVPGIARPTLRQQLAGDALTGLLAWWDAERDVYTDTGLTTRATDGASVAGWSDQGGSAYHVTQATAGDRPLWRASVAAFGGKPTLEYVSNDVLSASIASPVIANLNTYTIYVVFAVSTSDNRYLFAEDSSVSSTPVAAARISTGFGNAHRSDAGTNMSLTGTGTPGDGKSHVHTVRRIASNSWEIRGDGVVRSSGVTAPGTTSTNRLNVGGWIAAGNYMIGHIAQVLLYNTDNYATIEPILKAYYGIA